MTHHHDAIKLIKEVGQGCYLAKTDIKAPFISLSIHLFFDNLSSWQFAGHIAEIITRGLSPLLSRYNFWDCG